MIQVFSMVSDHFFAEMRAWKSAFSFMPKTANVSILLRRHFATVCNLVAQTSAFIGYMVKDLFFFFTIPHCSDKSFEPPQTSETNEIPEHATIQASNDFLNIFRAPRTKLSCL